MATYSTRPACHTCDRRELAVANKLYMYSNLRGTHGWASSGQDFRKRFGVKDGVIVRTAHNGIPAPPGYKKGERELANYPVIKVGAAESTKNKKPNFYGTAMEILQSSITGLDNEKRNYL